MLTKIKAFAVAGLGILTAVLYGLLQRSKRKRIEDEHEDVQNAQRIEREDAEITTKGLQDEAKSREEAKGKKISDHFR